MADTATGVAEQGFSAKIEDVGPCAKKVTIEITGERIAQKMGENFEEIRNRAALPGFRPGHVPERLLEKRFGADIRKDVQNQLVSESYQETIKSNKLEVVGEPEFEKDQEIKLPETGPLTFSFQVEIRPTFELPELKGIAVKKAKVEVNETHIEQAMKNLREQQGTLVPVENRGLESKDHVTADFGIKLEGKELGAQKDAQFVLQPGRIAGIFVEDADKQLAGLKPGESKTIIVKAPEDHPREDIRGREVQIEVAVKDIKKLELAEINQDFLDSMGFASEQELKDALKEQMEIRVKNDVQQGMRDQVLKFLMDNVKMELPTKLSQRQTVRTIQRRASDLLMRGMQAAEIEANIEKVKAGADQQAAGELKSYFILDKVAQLEEVEVTEGELNGQLAMIAMQNGERPEKLKQRLSKDGTLMNLYLKMRENKAVDKLLESAKIEEVAMPEEQKTA